MKTIEDFRNALFDNVVIPEGLNGVIPTIESLFKKIESNALVIAQKAYEEGANYVIDRLEPTINDLSDRIDNMANEAALDVKDLKNNLNFKFLTDEKDNE